jgi:hypothetical protein
MKAFNDLGIRIEGARKPRPAEREIMSRKGRLEPPCLHQLPD